MSATPPEANTEYSRGAAAPGRVFATRSADPLGGDRRTDRLRTFILAAALAGAAVLLAAEFTRLYTLNAAARGNALATQAAGPHHAYALAVLAVLAAALALGARHGPGRPLAAAIALIGAVALAIALLRDLPDAHARGVTRGFLLAVATPGPGLYLETLGAIVLILAGGLGMALLPGAGSTRNR